MARIAGPTGGYIVGFLVAAYLVGFLAERGWDRRIWTAALAMLVGELAIYAVGLPWLARFTGPQTVLAAGLIPFIPGDLYKLVLAAVALPAAWRLANPR
jgi:biotin transporter BioY